MRFLLVNPYYPVSETPSPPLGLAFLAAALEAAGAEVKLLDFVVFPYTKSSFEAVLKEFAPRFVGMTAVTMTFDHAIQIIQDVKQINADILTVMGGPHVTFCAKTTMEAFPELDFIVLGEGEATIVELAEASGKKCAWNKVKGIVYRDGADIVHTGIRKPVADLDSLPLPARHQVPLGRYRALGMPISMTTSRGCPFKCIFCVGRKMVGPRVRYWSPAKIVDEMEYVNTLNFHQINIADDLFTADNRHCLAVCDEIVNRKLEINWTAFARVDTVSKKLVDKLKEAGCHTLSFGVESANEKILRTIQKGISLNQVIDAVTLCTAAGITPQVSFILGLPGETPETLKETVDFGKRLKTMGVHHGFHLLVPFPGTEVREKSESYGIRILSNDWSEYHANRAIVETPTVNRKMLDDIVVEWENKFDEWLGEIKRRMESGEATPEEAWQLQRLEHTVLIYDLMMGSILEQKGFWHSGDQPVSQREAFKVLVGRIERSTQYTQQQIVHTLDFAITSGNLRYVQRNGASRWEWVDFL
ncbi:MAG: cobalamin-dependent protein [Deltaproteobacteria bacterium]|nr:cobalamin-dependent protein [Deltaproteobacteria bacterium]MBW2199843.1 cobalamin-dependent protein [Deltaproteobacteria bacterium]